MPTKDSAELREATSAFEQGLVSCGIDASNVDYDKLADTRQKLWDELDRIMDAHTAAQVVAASTKAKIDALDHVIGIYNREFEPNGEFRSFGSLTKVDVSRLYMAIGEYIRELEAHLTTGQKEES